MNTFDQAWSAGRHGIVTSMHRTFNAHGEVWDKADHRQMAIDILLSIGTNKILTELDEDSAKSAKSLGVGILLLDCYDGNGDFEYAFDCAVVKQPVFVNCNGGKRDVLKFYSKRLPCSCVKEEYKQARKIFPKVGECYQCDQRKERASLWVCGHCKVRFYCSRECQAAHWPEHKTECGDFADVRILSSQEGANSHEEECGAV
jgi:hypothetical protein